MKIDAEITILVGETTKIQITDLDARIRFVEVELDATALALALGRMGNVPCVAEVRGLHKIGLVHEHKALEFPLPADDPRSRAYGNERKELARIEAGEHCPKGWEPDGLFGSRGSFFDRDGKPWARTTIRRWVPRETSDD